MQAFAKALMAALAARLALGRLALAGAFALLALPTLELGYRLHTHRPVLALDDWRPGRIEHMTFGEHSRFDAELGWVPRDWQETEGYSTLAHGIRRNFHETKVRTGGILAVGDGFANGGMEVADAETWPAHLERLLDVPVLNAGVAGYAIDQIVLRAEQMLPTVRPKVLVIGVLEESIARAGLSSYGASKPYFTLVEGALAYHAPVRIDPDAHPPSGWRDSARRVLGRSAVLDAVLSHLTPAYWHGGAIRNGVRAIENRPAAVACALLQRLKTGADAAGTRVLMLLQYTRESIARNAEPGGNLTPVAACAAAMGIEIIDSLPALRTAVGATPGALDELYLEDDDGDRQMTSKGNRRMAEVVAAALSTIATAGK